MKNIKTKNTVKKFNDDKRLILSKTFGAFISSKSSKELIASCRKSRTFTRNIVKI